MVRLDLHLLPSAGELRETERNKKKGEREIGGERERGGLHAKLKKGLWKIKGGN